MLPVGKMTVAADARPRRDRARTRRRRYPPHGLAEPADLRRAGRQGRAAPKRPSQRSGSRPRQARSAPASSPAPAMPAASSRPPTPSATPRRSRAGARRASRSTTPVNIHLTGCHHSCAQHYIGDIGLLGLQGAGHRGRRHGRGLSHPGRRRLRPGRRARPRNLSRRQGRGRAATVERMLKAYLAHRASPEETFLAFTRRHDVDALKTTVRRGGGRMSIAPRRRRSRSLSPESAPFTRRAARLAQRLLRRPSVARRPASRRSRRADRGADAGRLRRTSAAMARGPPTTATTEAPWHDQTMPLAERMKLAEGRPLRRRMMAAMAQQDCGQCGYNCQDYSDAILLEKEERLNLCVPGGKETARMLKALHEELGSAPSDRQGAGEPNRCRAAAPRPRRAGARATIPPRRLSSRARGSTSRAREKETWHVEFDLRGTRHRLHGRRRLRHVSAQRSGAGRRRSSRRSARRRIFRSAAARCARC